MAEISNLVQSIRQAVYGVDVRESLASGIEVINTEAENTTARQITVEGRQDAVEARQDIVDVNESVRQANEYTRIETYATFTDYTNSLAAAGRIAYELDGGWLGENNGSGITIDGGWLQ